MTPAKKPTVSALLRKVQRLEARIARLQAALDKADQARYEHLCEVVDLRTRIHQAKNMLTGLDEMAPWDEMTAWYELTGEDE